MSRFLTPARPGLTPDVARTDEARLRGKGLLAVRLGWAAVAALSVGLFAAGVPSEFARLQTPCPTPICPTGQLPPAGLQSLTDLGFTPRFYAAATVAIGLAAGVLWEIGEWWGHHVVDDAIFVTYDDTIGDLAAGGAGALVAGIALPVLTARRRLHDAGGPTGGTRTDTGTVDTRPADTGPADEMLTPPTDRRGAPLTW